MYNKNTQLHPNQQLDPANLEPATPEFEPPLDIGVERLSLDQPEQLFKQSIIIHAKAEQYWNSDLGKRGSPDFEFNGKKNIHRKPEIRHKIELLHHDDDLLETDPNTDQKISRTELIIELYELVLEQAMSDMAEAKKILQESENKVLSIKGIIEQSDLETLRQSRDVLREAYQSQMLLVSYLNSFENGVSGYESFSRLNSGEEIDMSSRFEAFMRKILAEYRSEAGVTFDEAQNAGNYETVLAYLTKALKTDHDYLNLLSQVETKILELESGADVVEGISLEEEVTEKTGIGFDLPMFGDATSTEMGMDVLAGSTNSTLPEAELVFEYDGDPNPLTYDSTDDWQPNYDRDEPDLPVQKTPQLADALKK